MQQQDFMAVAPLDWWSLDDAERAVQLAGLMPWTVRLVRTWQIPEVELPRWWYRHEAYVHELLALRQARENAYSPDQALNGPISWVTELAAARVRWRQIGQDITDAGKPTAPPAKPPRWVDPEMPDAESTDLDFERFLSKLNELANAELD